MEFASELHDFLRKDVHRWYPDLEDKVSKERSEGGRLGATLSGQATMCTRLRFTFLCATSC